LDTVGFNSYMLCYNSVGRRGVCAYGCHEGATKRRVGASRYSEPGGLALGYILWNWLQPENPLKKQWDTVVTIDVL
jgi:hypothetical protein